MKKAILIISALVMVLSGVAAVSAYEAHTVNVTAKVENAILMEIADIDFGTIFPEEWLYEHGNVGLSTSAQTEQGDGSIGDLDEVDVTLYAEWKADAAKTANWYGDDPDHPTTPGVGWHTYAGYYNWMGDCLYVGTPVGTCLATDSGMVLVGAASAPPPSAQVTGLIYTFNDQQTATVYVAIDAPVFRAHYNSVTDAAWQADQQTTKPSGKDVPTWIIEEYYPVGSQTLNPLHSPGGLDLGIDLKFQVTDIRRVTT
jgi:hypothetical protein